MELHYESPEHSERFEKVNAAMNKRFYKDDSVRLEFDNFYEKYKDLPERFTKLKYVKKLEKRMMSIYNTYIYDETVSLDQVMTGHKKFFEGIQESMRHIQKILGETVSEAGQLETKAYACISGKA